MGHQPHQEIRVYMQLPALFPGLVVLKFFVFWTHLMGLIHSDSCESAVIATQSLLWKNDVSQYL